MKKRYAGFARRGEREGIPAEGFALWCRIGDLSDACGYDAAADGARLRELPDAYPALPGRDPEEYAGEHPVRALAALIRRFLAEYPETAEALLPAAALPRESGRLPEKAA